MVFPIYSFSDHTTPEIAETAANNLTVGSKGKGIEVTYCDPMRIRSELRDD